MRTIHVTPLNIWGYVKLPWIPENPVVTAQNVLTDWNKNYKPEIGACVPKDLLLYYYHVVGLSHSPKRRPWWSLPFKWRARELINQHARSKYALRWYQTLQSFRISDHRLDKQLLLCIRDDGKWHARATTMNNTYPYFSRAPFCRRVRASIKDGLLHTRVSQRVG